MHYGFFFPSVFRLKHHILKIRSLLRITYKFNFNTEKGILQNVLEKSWALDFRTTDAGFQCTKNKARKDCRPCSAG